MTPKNKRVITISFDENCLTNSSTNLNPSRNRNTIVTTKLKLDVTDEN